MNTTVYKNPKFLNIHQVRFIHGNGFNNSCCRFQIPVLKQLEKMKSQLHLRSVFKTLSTAVNRQLFSQNASF